LTHRAPSRTRSVRRVPIVHKQIPSTEHHAPSIASSGPGRTDQPRRHRDAAADTSPGRSVGAAAAKRHRHRYRSPLDPNLPSTTASKTAEELRRQQNIFNPEDALQNLPSTTIRKRYSGDRNALIGGRSFATSQAPRGLVLMDGYLISNFLGRFDAPRWNMMAPEEISRIDVLYGPFSAIYPGNSIGTTVAITTTRPKRFEGSVRVAAQSQRFDLYGEAGTYNNVQASALLGDRMASGLWWRLLLNRQDSTSQPMQWFTVDATAAGTFTPPAGTGAAVPVTGVQYDTGPKGLRRAVFGANSGAIDHTVQHTAKISLGVELGRELSAEAFVAYWRNDSENRSTTFLRDAAGNAVWSGRVSNEGNVFNIPASALAPFDRLENHAQAGATMKTRHASGWNGSIVTSIYRVLDDQQRTALNPEPVAADGGAGTGVQRDGTGFRTFELQGTYTPVAGDWTGGAHSLTFGLHANDYKLAQRTDTLPDWRSTAGTENQFVGGQTRLVALYAQDAWRLAPNWKATLGLRWESWRAFDGRQVFTPAPPAAALYPERKINATSPKLSLAWDAQPDLTLRVSAGKGTRFPTVSELFQGTRSGTTLVVNDPNLQPEVSNALELFAEKRFEMAVLRASVFQDDVRNTIWSQTNTAVFPAITNTQNVGRVRTRGVEFAGQVDELGLRGLTLDANIAFTRSTILENNFLASVGKNWVRVPRVRSALTLVYAPTQAWSLAATYRYAGRQWNELDNSDINPDVYGGLSRVKQLNLRGTFKPAALPGLELAAGIDNATDYRAYQSHPFPARTFFGEARYAF
jgi:iron complex outermembrane recepter protein